MEAKESTSGRKRGIQLNDRQRLAWLRLIRSDNVGPATFRDLINHCGTAENALAMLPDLARRGGGRKIRIATVGQAEDELDKAARSGARFICIGEPDYPAMLRAIAAAPPLIAVAGDPHHLSSPAVAIVGSRNASAIGCKFAAKMARDLGRASYVVVSGLARGIDQAAHRAALDHGTIAAMAGGLDRPYPPENRDLYDRIRDGGGVALSEMPFGWEPRARDFPRRNRLIAGLASGLIVIEAASRSGSLISARLANEFGRLVFAVPGSPLDPRCDGTNALLKQGAIVTTSADDVIEALAPGQVRPSLREDTVDPPAQAADTQPTPEPANDARTAVLSALGPTPVFVDDIVEHSGVSARDVQSILLEIELAGRLVRQINGAVSLRPGE